jgi:hypothetical protein
VQDTDKKNCSFHVIQINVRDEIKLCIEFHLQLNEGKELKKGQMVVCLTVRKILQINFTNKLQYCNEKKFHTIAKHGNILKCRLES